MQKLNLHKLKCSINNLCKFLDDTYGINYGGCCYLAALIARYLDRLDIKYSLIVYDACKKNKSYIEYEILNKSKNKHYSRSVTGNNTCNHYCLRIHGSGIINETKLENVHRYVINDVDSKSISWIYRSGVWNNCYKTKYNKTIKSIVKEFFREYEKIPNF
jgi:hypothetical protein